MRIIFLSLLVFLVFSCDSSSNLELSSQDYFVKYFGNDGEQVGVDMVMDPDGNYYLLGTTDSKNNIDGKQVYLVKADSKGNLIWEKTFGGKKDEEARDLIITTDGKLAFVSNTISTSGTDKDILLSTISLDGTLIKSTVFGFSGKDEIAYSISQTNDGFLVAGSTTNVDVKPGGSLGSLDLTDGLQVRFYSDLITPYSNIWRKTNGYENTDVMIKVEQNTDGSFYVFGFSNRTLATSLGGGYNFWITQLGTSGEPAKNGLFPGTESDERLSTVIISPLQSGEGYLLAGQSIDQANGSKLYITKLRKPLTFTDQDYLFRTKTNVDLRTSFEAQKVSACASMSSGFYILSNETQNGDSNWQLTKINNNGNNEWAAPVIFGGENNDTIGSIVELPDGKIAILGTMEIGGKVPEKKMTLIKVNSSGKFAK